MITASTSPLVSVVMPCLNEEGAIGKCIEKIRVTFASSNIDGEIVVVDNGSTDRSAEIAMNLGARVVHQPIRGYGSAYQMGFHEARGQYLVMGDADDTYDFTKIPEFLAKLRDGFDFVTGSRFLSSSQIHSNPLLHRFFGNPALTMLLNFLFRANYTDVYCGFRAFTKEAYRRIRPVSQGMEFNLELAINSRLANLRIAEIPIDLHPRIGESKLRTFRDGWRSLRMMLLYSPNKLFFAPGLALLLLGIIVHGLVWLPKLEINGHPVGPVTSIVAMVATVVGVQILSLGLHAKTYSWSRRFDKENALLQRFYGIFKLELGLLLGASMVLAGVGIGAWLLYVWTQDAGPVPMRVETASLAATLVMVGFHAAFSSLFISAMSIATLPNEA